MNKAKRYTLSTIVLIALATQAVALAPFKKVSIATTTTSSTSTTTTSTTEPTNLVAGEAKNENGTAGPTKNPKLTGIPQIDYIWDPNLPRELRGYNLSSYPFFSTVPPEEDIHFKCDGLHDGFYASIEFKCQVYHHCVYGIRHDFLCANFTAFDQKTFICHFVSDVDCEGSQKYWNRNDALYMATTTTTTTTTTTEPPPTPRRRLVRPFRPLRRPMNRRPIDDYYYDEEEYADDDYYEERVNQRRKQRPRHRKPQLNYDDDYDEKRSFSEEEKPRRHNTRDRFRDTDMESIDDYGTERRKHDRPKVPNKANVPAERRKNAPRRPAAGGGRAGVDERRSFGDERPVNGRKDKLRPTLDDAADNVDVNPRRGGVSIPRRRANEKRPLPTASTTADIDDLDYYEKPNAQAIDDEAAAEEDISPKVKTTPKPLEEFITPKASSSSVFARPRAPPRISRPVPVTEKKKFEYSIQKTTATTPASAGALHSDIEDYDEYDEYDETLTRPRAPANRRRVVEDVAIKSESDDFPTQRRRTHNDAPIVGRKPTRTTIRKPVTEKKSILSGDDEYDSTGYAHSDRFEGRPVVGRKRPHGGRTRIPSRVANDDVDFVDDDYDEPQPVRPAHRLRPKTLARKGAIKPRPVLDEEEDNYDAEPEQPVRHRSNLYGGNGRHKNGINSKLRHQTDSDVTGDEGKTQLDSEADDADAAVISNKNQPTTVSSGRPSSVRVVKRPFLPSRGGSPYLPRGLQPVGIAHKPLGNGNGNENEKTTDSSSIDMGSTISGVHLLEHGAPILRNSGNERDRDHDHDQNRNVEKLAVVSQTSPRTTLPPRSAIPVGSQPRPEPEPQFNKATLDELYETDYDVTLNDALNPTLKPLSPHPNHHHTNRNYASAYASTSPGSANPFVSNNQSPAIYHSINNNNNNNNNNKNNNENYQHQIAYQTLSSSHHSQPQTLSHNQQSQHQNQQHQQHQQYQHQSPNNYNSDSYFSSTDIRRRAIVVAAPAAHSGRPSTQYRGVGARIAQHFYDDFDY